MYRNTTYHFVKIVNGEEKLIIETESSCLERALDYLKCNSGKIELGENNG